MMRFRSIRVGRNRYPPFGPEVTLMPRPQRTIGGPRRHGFRQCLARSGRFGWSVIMLILGQLERSRSMSHSDGTRLSADVFGGM